MSRIYFHTPSRDLEIPGCERAHLSLFVQTLGVGPLLDTDRTVQQRLASWLPNASPEHLRLSLTGFPDHYVRLPSGERYDLLHLHLNTALRIGNDVVQFMARVHAQCEVHGYIAAASRFFFARLIEKGIASGLLRSGDQMPGDYEPWKNAWVRLAEYLHDPACMYEPVVMSYSVCHPFPDYDLVADGLDRDSWDDLQPAQRWELALTALRQRGPELDPYDWESGYRVGHGKDVFWLLERLEDRP